MNMWTNLTPRKEWSRSDPVFEYGQWLRMENAHFNWAFSEVRHTLQVRVEGATVQNHKPVSNPAINLQKFALIMCQQQVSRNKNYEYVNVH